MSAKRWRCIRAKATATASGASAPNNSKTHSARVLIEQAKGILSERFGLRSSNQMSGASWGGSRQSGVSQLVPVLHSSDLFKRHGQWPAGLSNRASTGQGRD